MPAQRDHVPFTPEARQDRLAWVATGHAAAYRRTRARMLLQADQRPQGPAWSAAPIPQAWHVGCQTGARPRATWVDVGREAALQRHKRARPGHQTVEGSQDAPLLAVACSTPPAGPTRGT
jgi:hypothetical protein